MVRGRGLGHVGEGHRATVLWFAMLSGKPGCDHFSYWERYPNETTTATTAAEVGEVTIGFAVIPQQNSSQTSPIVLTQTVRLAAVLDDPSA